MTKPRLSICIGHRSRGPLLAKAVAALFDGLSAVSMDAELVIADWPDAERPGMNINLKALVVRGNRVMVRIVHDSGAFTRGGARNVAARASRGEILFFMDADMLCPAEVLRRGVEVADSGKVFLPLYDRIGKDSVKITAGVGTGNAFMLRLLFERFGGFPEHDHWGGEDTVLFRWAEQNALAVREKIDGFLHQWHPGGA